MSADLSHRYYRLKWHVTSGVSTVGPQPLTFRKGRVSQPAYRYPPFCTRSISVDEAEFNYPWRPNRCIYCEADTDGLQKSRLRNEHIIPAGIGGTLVLQGASCKACEKVIGRSESKMINGVFATPRAHVGIIRKTKYKLTVLVDGSREQEILVPMPEHPVMLMMAQLMPPRLLSGRTSQESGIGSLWTKGFQFDPAAFSADERRDGLSATFDALRFVHMLAKIAHSYMAAEVRLENVVSYLRSSSGAIFMTILTVLIHIFTSAGHQSSSRRATHFMR